MTPELLESLQRWAAPIMERAPDIVMAEQGVPYILRWELPSDTVGGHAYLHHVVRSERPDAMHGHDLPNTSIILTGRYIEHMADGAHEREPGNVVHREPEDEHRMELHFGETCVTLFLTGDKVEAWKDGRYAEIGDFA